MPNSLRFLCVGDVVGKIGRTCLLDQLNLLVSNHQIDSVIVNVENSAAGFGVTRSIYNEFKRNGIDVMTSGNHIYDRREIVQEIDKLPALLRPINFPKGQPGKGFYEYQVKGHSVCVINAIGRVFMNPSDCPFQSIDEFLAEKKDQYQIIILDFHAETTSEKLAMGFAMDGKVSCVYGTHTHVQTADEKILPKGTAYLTDLGMVGGYYSVIGMKKEAVVQKFYDQMPKRFEPVELGSVVLNAIVVEIDVSTGKAVSLERLANVYQV